jgi:hypothetical protein
VIEVREAAVTLQATPPTVTCTSDSVVEKPEPAIDTVVPVTVALVIVGVNVAE